MLDHHPHGAGIALIMPNADSEAMQMHIDEIGLSDVDCQRSACPLCPESDGSAVKT